MKSIGRPKAPLSAVGHDHGHDDGHDEADPNPNNHNNTSDGESIPELIKLDPPSNLKKSIFLSFTSSDIRTEVKILLKLALPIIVSSALAFSMSIVDLAMIGRLGETQLAGSALGNMWFNIWCTPLLGVMSAMDTLFAQVCWNFVRSLFFVFCFASRKDLRLFASAFAEQIRWDNIFFQIFFFFGFANSPKFSIHIANLIRVAVLWGKEVQGIWRVARYWHGRDIHVLRSNHNFILVRSFVYLFILLFGFIVQAFWNGYNETGTHRSC
jgi:hypothetical protein